MEQIENKLQMVSLNPTIINDIVYTSSEHYN